MGSDVVDDDAAGIVGCGGCVSVKLIVLDGMSSGTTDAPPTAATDMACCPSRVLETCLEGGNLGLGRKRCILRDKRVRYDRNCLAQAGSRNIPASTVGVNSVTLSSE